MQLGVLFCDQVGSTALLTRLGDALAEEIRRDLFHALHLAAERCRGDVIKGSGDGLMVVFPTGASDALRCGELMLLMVNRLARRELWADVQFKVGVSYGDALYDDGDWYGAAVNLAARLCAAAAPCHILATTDFVKQASAQQSAWEPLESLPLKGFPEPVAVTALHVDDRSLPAWPTPVDLDPQGMAPLIGRDGVLGELAGAWATVRAGQDLTLALSGPAGIGVSRVLAEAAGVVAGSGVILHASGRAQADWIEQLIRCHAASSSLHELRADAGPDASALAAICPLVGLRLDAIAEAGAAIAEEELLHRLLARIATRRPVLVLLDDVDAEPRFPIERVMLLTGVQSETSLERPGRTFTLGPLHEADVAEIVDASLPAGTAWGSELVRLIVAETNGVPRDVIAVLDSLIRATADGQLDLAASSDAVRRAVPYKGLQVFDEDDTVRFYGRDTAVQDVMAGLKDRGFAVVVGSSGSGKSSVVRAGCLPQLAADHELVVLSPGDEPVRALAITWATATGVASEVVLRALHSEPPALPAPDLGGRPILLVIDQLEECFTLCTDDDARDRFLRAMTHPMAATPVLATLRGDYFGRASEHPQLAKALRAGTVLMTPPTTAELRELIEAPARAAHLQLEAGLAELILADISERPGSLPLLSHALRETWRRRHGNTLSVADYRAAGGATGAIARTADTVYEQLTESERETAKRIFLRLTALGEGAEDSRRRVPVDVLVATGAGESRQVLQTLTAARLVTADTDAEGRDVDELAHEALLREWPRLREWLDEDRDELRDLAHLETAARDWDTSGLQENDLYTGRRLEAAEAISPDKLNDRERQYLTASIYRREAIRKAARRARRRLQTVAVVAVVGLLIASAAGVIAFGQRHAARVQAKKAVTQGNRAQQQALLATARGLSAQSVALQRTQPDAALLLAVEAQKLRDSPETRDGLMTVLSASPHLERIAQSFGHDIFDFALSPDGRTAAVARSNGSFQVFDFASEKPLTPNISVDANPIEVRWLSNEVLATAWNDGAFRLWNGRTGKLLRKTSISVDPGTHDFAISPDGKLLAVADGQDTVHIYRSSDFQLIATASEHQSIGLHELAFNAAGDRLAIGGAGGLSGGGGSINIIDPLTGQQLVPPSISSTSVYDGLAYSPDGRTVAAGTESGIVALFDSSTGQLLGNLGGHTDAVNQVAYSRDGKYVASTARDGTVIVWRSTDGSMVGKPFTGHSIGGEGSVAFTPDSRHLVSAAKNEVITWGIADRTALPGTGLTKTTSTDVVVDRERKLLLSSGDDGDLHVWNSETLKPTGASKHLQSIITDVAVDPTRGILAAGLSGGGTVLAPRPGGGIDLLTAAAQPRVLAHLNMTDTPEGLAFSPSGNQLAVATFDGGLVVFDLTKPTHPSFTVQVDAFGGDTVGWTADGSRILFAGGSLFATIDVRTHKVSQQSHGPTTYAGVLHPSSGDGTIASAAYGGHVDLFRPDGTPSGRPKLLAASPLWDSVISPNGDLVAASGGDGTLTIWSLLDGTRLASDLPLTEGASWVAFLDDHRIVVAGLNDSFDVLDLTPTALVSQACALVGRNLTRQEFAQYLGSEPYHKTCTQWPAGT